jgi:hypothetical protein
LIQSSTCLLSPPSLFPSFFSSFNPKKLWFTWNVS